MADRNSGQQGEKDRKANRTILGRTIFLMLLCGIAIFVPLLHQLYTLQIVEHDFYEQLAIEQQTRDTVISANRGVIYDRNYKALAISASVETISITPVGIKDEAEAKLIAEGLAGILNLDVESIYKKTQATNYYQLIARKVEKDVADRVRAFKEEYKLAAVRIDPDTKRYYTYGTFASQIIGFVGVDNEGLEGIEAYYDEVLTGKPGKIVTAKNARGTDMPFSYEKYYDPEDGLSVVLTIDETIQHFLEKHLAEAVVENQVKNRATGIVMNVNTGEILGMATTPSYDLNNPRAIVDEKVNEELANLSGEEYTARLSAAQALQWRNKPVVDTYEPGSTFKIMTTAMALEEGTKSLSSTFDCNGSTRVTGWGSPISCWKKVGHGHETLAEALQNSCNPAFVNIGLSIGREKFYAYLEAFGFGQKTGIDMYGEAAGLLHDKETFMKNDVDLAVAAFGQRFNVTPLQQITAVSAVVNGGYLMKPHIVKEFVDADGNVARTVEPEVVRQVISEETSETMRGLVESVVSDGTGRNAGIAGYRIGGKTGTSEKANAPKGDYDVSFIGIAPADKPEIALLVILDSPGGPLNLRSGGYMAAPLAKRILADILPYMGYEPQFEEGEGGSAELAVPNLVGLSRQEAEKALNEKGMSFSTDGDADVVTDQIPAAGSKIPATAKVVLYFGSERPAALVTVPNVIGMSPERANQAMTNAGLYIRPTGPTASGGAVSASLQSIASGTQVARGVVVDVEFRDSSVGDDAH